MENADARFRHSAALPALLDVEAPKAFAAARMADFTLHFVQIF
jgi:hypothetical protein